MSYLVVWQGIQVADLIARAVYASSSGVSVSIRVVGGVPGVSRSAAVSVAIHVSCCNVYIALLPQSAFGAIQLIDQSWEVIFFHQAHNLLNLKSPWYED